MYSQCVDKMKWVYAQAAFIPIILSHFKDKMPINTQKQQQISYRNHKDTIDIDYYENLFRS